MSADLTADLDRIEALAGKATEGPWLAMLRSVIADGPSAWSVVADVDRQSDAAFIADARTTVPDLVAVVRAVLAVHVPRRDAPGSLVTWEFCSCGATEAHVFDDGGFATGPARYPCATVQAITTAWEAQR